MSVQYLSSDQARTLVLSRLRQWRDSLPPARRELKLLHLGYMLSPNDIIREVEHNTDLGQRILAAQLAAISQVEGVSYVVR